MRRAMAERSPTGPQPRLYQQTTRLRVAFACLAILAVLALAVDSLLASVAFLHHTTPKQGLLTAAPSLTPSATSVTYGQTITLTLSHFVPLTQVLLTHDVEIPLQTSTGNSLIRVDHEWGDKSANDHR